MMKIKSKIIISILFTILITVCSSVIFATCETTFKGEYIEKNGIIIGPKGGLSVISGDSCSKRVWQRWCSNTAHHWVTKTWDPKVYISSKAATINEKCTTLYRFDGTKTDILNAIKKSAYTYYIYNNGEAEKVNYNLAISLHYFPSADLDNIIKKSRYDIPTDAIYYDFVLPGVHNYSRSIGCEYMTISSALEKFVCTKILKNGGTFSFKGTVKVFINGSMIKIQLGKDCTTLKIINNTLYCDNTIISNNTTTAAITYEFYIDYGNVFNLLNSKISIATSCSYTTSNVDYKGDSYSFNHPGLYYVSDNAGTYSNKPVLVVEPKLVGTYHTTIYPENKIEERELFNVIAAGIGDHWIKIVIGSYSRVFIIPQGASLKGVIRLDFNSNKMYIKYFINGIYNSTDYVTSLSSCLHRDCVFPYEIWYDDGYNFNTFTPKLFASSNITIKWTSLSISFSKTTIHDSYPANFTIYVTNNGPVKAKDVGIYNLFYNPSCIRIIDISPKRDVNTYDTKSLWIVFKIQKVNCKASDYVLSFDVYGWNTYSYHFSIPIPVSHIFSPPQNSLISKTTYLDIKDPNAIYNCTITANGYTSSRTCNDIFYPYSLCEKNDEPDCYITLTSENKYFKFISSTYKFRTEAYLNLSHKRANLTDKQFTTFLIIVKNEPDPNVKAKDVKLSKYFL